MIPQVTFAIHVMYTCPLACAHCCFSSSPRNKDKLHISHIRETIAALPSLGSPTMKLVAFTGGEPFLLGHELDGLVQQAHRLGYTTRVVTSAYWAKSPQVAQRRLAELVRAGLSELSISWDDFHEEFVSFEAVRNAFTAAKLAGIDVAINSVQTQDSKWTSETIRNALGLSVEDADSRIYESELNRTGRAASKLADAKLRSDRYLGPCTYVISEPTLSARNKLLACCGVVPETDALVLDHDFAPANLSAAVRRGAESALLNWIHLRGPYAIMQWISVRYGIPIPEKQDVSGNCEACRLLFTTPALAERIPEAVKDKAAEIAGELQVLDALGWLGNDDLSVLWEAANEVVVE